MSAAHYRALIALANFLLLGAITLVGIRSFRGATPAANEMPPNNFSPLQFEIPYNTGPRTSIREYMVIWQQLDRPKPRVIRSAPVNTPQQPRVTDLSGRYSLVMANYSPQDPKSSTVILQGPGPQVTLAVGDKLADGYEVKSIIVRGRGDSREAVVTVTRSGKEQKISLKRSQSK